ncbi:MAG: protein rep [Bacteroidetes bacterium]|nr:protein rep [Bacteroidota bacterium]
MQNPASYSEKKIYTLGISGTDVPAIVQPKPTAIVNGKGSDMKDSKVLQKRAKQKTIAQKVILALIDDAQKKGKDKWVKSLWNAYRCQGEVVTANGKLYGRYCKYRICPICASIRKAEKINDYLPVLKTWTDAHFVTLTLKSVPAYKLKPVIDCMVEEWKQIIDTYKKREQRNKGSKLMGIKSLECNFNPTRGTYNPHYHIIVPTREMAEILIKEWLTRSKPGWTHRKGQFARKVVNTERDMIEIVKYGTKILTEPDPRKKKFEKGKRKVFVSALNNILMAFDGHRLFDRFGFNLPTKKTKPASKITCVTDHKNWEFDPAVADWVNKNSGDRLTGYLPPAELVDILKDGIDTELE